MKDDFLSRINYTDLAAFLQYGATAEPPPSHTELAAARIREQLENCLPPHDHPLINEIFGEVDLLNAIAFREGLQAGIALAGLLSSG